MGFFASIPGGQVEKINLLDSQNYTWPTFEDASHSSWDRILINRRKFSIFLGDRVVIPINLYLPLCSDVGLVALFELPASDFEDRKVESFGLHWPMQLDSKTKSMKFQLQQPESQSNGASFVQLFNGKQRHLLGSYRRQGYRCFPKNCILRRHLSQWLSQTRGS